MFLGIDVTSGFTATVNADLKVGALEETITVAGQSPVVDTQNVRTQNVLTRQILDALPSNRAVPAMAALTVGMVTTGIAGSTSTQDVGGNKGENYSGLAIHGTSAVGQLGRPASHGCVRLHPAHARALYGVVRSFGGAQIQVRG